MPKLKPPYKVQRATDTRDEGAPHFWATLAEEAEATGRWYDAARLWAKASCATSGHSRAAMYDNAEEAALDQLHATL